MANIPVGTKIPITEYIPLPSPRPVMDKLLEYTPFVPSQGLDLPTVGTEWLLIPFRRGLEVIESLLSVEVSMFFEIIIILWLGVMLGCILLPPPK